MKQTIDVIIPTRNRASLTVEAMQSVLAQTHDGLQLFVVDDASDDSSREEFAALARSDARVTVVEREASGGAQQARQSGLEASTSPFVAILDSDDLWEPTKLQKQLQHYQRHAPEMPALGAILCGHVWCDATGSPLGAGRLPVVHGRAAPLVSDNMSAVFVRRDAIVKAGGFLPAGEISRPGANHIDFFLRLAQHCEMSAVEEVLVRCRKHEGKRDSDVLRGRTGADNLAYLLQRHASYLDEWPRERARLRARTAARYLAIGERREGSRYMVASLKGAGVASAGQMLRQYGPFTARSLLASKR